MNVEIHILTFNEERILPYALRHYVTFASKIVVHDMGSTDSTLDIVGDWSQFGVKLEKHDGRKEFDDRLNKQIKQESWKGSKADWIIQADADELIYFPLGAQFTLSVYESKGITVAKPYGFEMTGEKYPVESGQIYDEIKMGARDDKWYAKPILFSAKRCKHIEFSTGAHTCETTLTNGVKQPNPTIPTMPSCFLLHFHQIGPVEAIAAKYDATKARMSEMNKKMGWGNMEPGIKHAKDKRAMIHSKLQRVIA